MNGVTMTRWAARLAGAAIVLTSTAALAQPSLVPLQGYLTDDLGQPIDGQIPATFTVFGSPAGADDLHTETLGCLDPPNDCLVISDGHFIVHLGAEDALDLAIFAGDDSVYVEVEIDGETLTPRMALETVPFAAYAGYAGSTPWDGLSDVPADIADGDDNTEYTTTSPLVLDVADDSIGLASAGCAAGDGWIWNGAGWSCEPAAGEPYTAGNGITVDPATRVISQNATTCVAGQVSRWNGTAWTCVSDATGITSLDAGPGIGVVGNRVQTAAATCGAGEFSRWNGSAWICATDDTGTAVTAGNGIDVAAGEVSIDSPTCGANEVSRWNGSTWACVTDREGITGISAGDGIGVVGTEIAIASPACAANQYSRWNGDAWTCVNDLSAVTTAGNGIDVTGSTVSIDSPGCGANEVSRWTGGSWACVTDQGIRTLTNGNGIGVSGSTISIASPACDPNEYSRWNGTAWTCVSDNSTAYAGGDGISISGGTVDIDSPTCSGTQVSRWTGSAWACVTDQGIRTLVPGNGVAVSGSTISIAADTCSGNQYSRWNGTAWVCATDVSTSYTAGNGIAVSGGGVISQVATTCGVNQYAYWNGSAWLCRNDREGLTSITPGPGITVSGNTVSIGSSICIDGQYSRWTAGGWTCADDLSASYGAGPGIQLVGSNFGINAIACGGNQYSRWNGSAWVCATDRQGITSVGAGLGIGVSGGNTVSIASSVCNGNEYSRWTAGGWICAVDRSTTYSAGNGLTLSGTQFRVNAATCTGTQHSRWTGSSWVCGDDNAGVTSVGAGAAIRVTGAAATPTISLSSTTCGTDEVWQWTGSAWDCRQVLTDGNGLRWSGSRTLYVRTGPGVTVSSDAVRISSPTCNASTQKLIWDGDSFECVNDQQGITGVTGSTTISASGSANRTVSLNSSACGTNSVWQWTGSSWTCRTPVTAGNGLGMSSNRDMYVQVGNGLSLSSDRVQINASTCSGSQASRWTGSSWTCVNLGGSSNVLDWEACTDVNVGTANRTVRTEYYYPSWGGENSIQVRNTGGGLLWTVDAWNGGGSQNGTYNHYQYNVAPGTYRLYLYESYGDGWHGGWVRVRHSDGYGTDERLYTGTQYTFGSGYCYNSRYNCHTRYYTFTVVAGRSGYGGTGSSNCAPASRNHRIVHGTVDANGNIWGGTGFRVFRSLTTGVFHVYFTNAFAYRPSAVATQVYAFNHSAGGSTLDNAIITGLDNSRLTVVTGDGGGGRSNRAFSFIAIGAD